MKKYFSMILAVAAIAVSCNKNNTTPNTNGNQEPKNEVTYEGVTYKTVTLVNGQTWMAENLRFVPKGKTVSDKASEAAGIWYPYTIEGGKAVAAKDEATIAKNGYLYDFATAFGVAEITPENLKSFEGTRGICPEGWHIPTRADFLALCGNALKAEGETEMPMNDRAPFYDETLKAGSIEKFVASDWNFTPCGYVNRANMTKSGMYFAVAATADNCSIAELVGKPSMTNFLGSTGYKATNNKEGVLVNMQFFTLNTMFVKSFPQGKVQAGYGNVLSGYPLRCIKD